MPEDVDQHRRPAVGGDDGQAWLESRRHQGDVADADRHVVDDGDDDGGEIVGRRGLPAHQCELELVVLVDEAGRGDDIGVADGVGDLRKREAACFQPRAIDGDVILPKLASRHADAGHA